MNKRLSGAVLGAAMGFALVAVWAVSSGDTVEAVRVEQTGYFKDERNHRVQAYHSPARLTEAQATEVFEDAPRTAGRILQVVIYSGPDNPAPADAVTLAPGLRHALEVISTPPHDDWDWRFIVNPAGEISVKRQ